MLFTMLMTPVFLFSVIMSLSSYSWMMIWIGMEINLIVFIMFNIQSKNIFTMESSMKYFLVQSSGSLILLFSMTMNTVMYEEWPQMYMYSIPLAMMLKSGMAPFHVWTPQIVNKMSYTAILLFLTMQKIVPLTICFCSWMEILILSALLNVLMGSIGGLTQSSLIKMMIFSSLNNTGWMIMSMVESFMMFLYYFSIYFLMTLLIMWFLKIKQMKWMLQSKSMNIQEKIMFYLLLLSMSGLPPLLGFTPKWMVLSYMHINMPYFTTTFIIMSIFTMFFYVKSCMTSLFMSNLTNKLMFKMKSFELSMKFMLAFNLMGVPAFYILT